jgi:hypothetical protein
VKFTSLIALMLLSTFLATATTHAQEAKQVGTDVTIDLINGDRITGKLLEQSASEILIDNEYLGLIRIRRDSIKPPEPPPAEVVKIKSPWSGSFDLSITGKSGNNNEQNMYSEFNARRETESTIDTYRMSYERSLAESSSGSNKSTDTTVNRKTAEARREWFLDETKWRPYIQGYVDDDTLMTFKRRYRISAGGAYPWIETDQERWTGRIGMATAKDRSGTETSWRPEAALGTEYFLQINTAQSFSAGAELYPVLDDDGGYQSITRAEYRFKLVADAPWTVKIGAEQSRNSKPDPGDKKSDLTYYFAAGFVF